MRIENNMDRKRRLDTTAVVTPTYKDAFEEHEAIMKNVHKIFADKEEEGHDVVVDNPKEDAKRTAPQKKMFLSESIFSMDDDADVLGDVLLKDEIKVDDESVCSECNSGIATDINKLIVDEWEAIQGYNDAIQLLNNLPQTDNTVAIRKIFDDILTEENVHVGQLQSALQLVDPSADAIADGHEEGEKTIDASEGVDDSLTENLTGNKRELAKIVIEDIEQLTSKLQLKLHKLVEMLEAENIPTTNIEEKLVHYIDAAANGLDPENVMPISELEDYIDAPSHV